MSLPAAHEIKERIRDSIGIVELVGSYLPLHRRGNLYLGLCPFHPDKNPSLQVNPDRQTFKCWSCGAGGDIFAFVMRRETLEFRDALEMLADRAGVPLATTGPAGTGPAGTGPAGTEAADSRKRQFEVLAWAAAEFHAQLLTAPSAAAARDYVADRGLHAESVGRFRLGYAPAEWQWLRDRANRRGYPDRLLESVGLISRSAKSDRMFDRFRNRLMFPIQDPQGRVVAFGGRILPGDDGQETAKYVNSTETRLFTKSQQLYGLFAAREALAKGQPCVVMEGYTDVIMAWQHGLRNAVAVLGTALGARHVELLRRYTDRVVLILDGDEAGTKRANEVLALFMSSPLDLRIVTLPDDQDPCDFCERHGDAPLRALIETAPDALAYKLERVLSGIDVSRDVHAANAALEETLTLIAQIPTSSQVPTGALQLRLRQALALVAREFRVTPEEAMLRIQELRRTATVVKEETAEGQGLVRARDPLAAWDRDLLALLAAWPNLLAQAFAEIQPRQLQSSCGREILDAWRLLFEHEGVGTIQDLLLSVENLELKSILVDIDEHAAKLGRREEEVPGVFTELLAGLRDRDLDRHLDQAATNLQAAELTEQQQLDAVLQILEQQRNRQGISVPTEG